MQICFSLITSYQSPSTFQCKNEPHKDGGIVVMRIVIQTEADYGSITASYISVQRWPQNYNAGSGILQPKSPRLSEPLHSFIMKYSQNIPAKYWLQKTAKYTDFPKTKVYKTMSYIPSFSYSDNTRLHVWSSCTQEFK